MKRGLVSITFRRLCRDEIARHCHAAELDYIEWGGDVHVPAGDLEAAADAARLCREYGIEPAGYGSYYNAADDFCKFGPVLSTAEALGAGYIRIWAGRGREYDEAAEENIARAVREAADKNIRVSLECHRKTMTEDPRLAVRLAAETGCLLHFQPNPDIGFEENLRALTLFAPHLCACHVFAWDRGDVRLPLSAQARQWREYAKTAPDVPFLLEFVKDDDVNNLYTDAEMLGRILEPDRRP